METLCTPGEAQLGSANRSVLARWGRTYRFLLGIVLPRGSGDGLRVTKRCLGIFVGMSLVLWDIGAFLWRHPKYPQVCSLCPGRGPQTLSQAVLSGYTSQDVNVSREVPLYRAGGRGGSRSLYVGPTAKGLPLTEVHTNHAWAGFFQGVDDPQGKVTVHTSCWQQQRLGGLSTQSHPRPQVTNTGRSCKVSVLSPTAFRAQFLFGTADPVPWVWTWAAVALRRGLGRIRGRGES